METILPINPPNVSGNPWLDAMADACAVSFVAFTPDDPRQTLADLVSWEVDVALDPMVSHRARDLMAVGAPDARRWRKLIRAIEMGDDALFVRIEECLDRAGIPPDAPLTARDFTFAFDAATDGICSDPLTGREILGETELAAADASPEDGSH